LSTEFGIQVPTSRFEDAEVVRIAGAVYNTPDDYERLADALLTVRDQRS
jgi:hypothetical protein